MGKKRHGEKVDAVLTGEKKDRKLVKMIIWTHVQRRS